MQDKTKKLLSDIFSLDSGFMKLCERIFDLAILNLLFLLSCLPILTIGAAKLSLFTCLNLMEEQEKIVPWVDYSQAFKANIREGFYVGLIEHFAIGICLLNLFMLHQQTGVLVSLIRVLSYGMLLLALITFLYVYPLASRYQMGLKELLVKSFLMACLNAPRTLLMLVILLGVFLLLTSSTLVFLGGLSLMAVIGLSLFALLQNHLIRKALDENSTKGHS